MRGWILATCLLTSSVNAAEHKVFGNAIIRYENETSHTRFADRERMRLVAHLGLNSVLSENWRSQIRLRTGLKNRQNVPAITFYRFTDQPQPDNDVFVDRAMLTGRWKKIQLRLGKIPLQPFTATDMYWDHNLNPIGASLDVSLNDQQTLQVYRVLPLDGATDTVGKLTVVQWQSSFKMSDWTLRIAPWLSIYEGQPGAEFARRDTQYDNHSLRLSATLSKQHWQIGMDLGHAFNGFDAPKINDFKGDKSAWALQVQYGKLSAPGDWQAHLRVLRAERFGVIREFAQNALSRFITGNFRAIDARYRYQLSQNMWVGARISRVEALRGEPDKGTRIRIEAKYRF